MDLINILIILVMVTSIFCDVYLYEKFLKKLNDHVNDYTNLMIKYNELKTQFDKSQIEAKKHIEYVHDQIIKFQNKNIKFKQL